MRRIYPWAIWVAGVTLGLGVIAGPAQAGDRYYLDDDCEPVPVYEHVRVYEPIRVYEPVRAYEPVRVYEVDPYCDAPPYLVYGYAPRYDHYYRDEYYRRARGFSFDISIQFGRGTRYRRSYDHYGYRSRRHWD
jgi:hypothetical protein